MLESKRVEKRNVVVLLAAFNGEKFIRHQLDTILAQEGVDVTIFISIDSSDDSTVNICQEYETLYSNVNILELGYCFGGAAKNFFRLIRDVDFSGYDFVAFSDQDDVWLGKKLSHACEVIISNKLDAYSSDVIAFWPDGREKLVKKSYPQKQFDYFFEAAGPGCSYVLKRDALQKFKNFLNKNWTEVNQVALHDWIIYAFCRSNNMQWHIDDLPLMCYRQHNSNQVGFNSGLKAYSKRISMVKDKWYRTEVEKIVSLVDVNSDSGFRLERWYLIQNFWQLRRRPRDAFALLAMLFVGVF